MKYHYSPKDKKEKQMNKLLTSTPRFKSAMKNPRYSLKYLSDEQRIKETNDFIESLGIEISDKPRGSYSAFL